MAEHACRSGLPAGDVAVQDVLADEVNGYEWHSEVFGSSLSRAGDVGLWPAVEGATLVVGRLPGWAAYPRPRGHARPFTLGLGPVGRWLANLRFFEDRLVHGSNAVVEPGPFVEGRPDHVVEQRVHLYGGVPRTAGPRRSSRLPGPLCSRPCRRRGCSWGGPVKVLAGTVVAHRGPGVGVSGGDNDGYE